jgi:hypothetical protein
VLIVVKLTYYIFSYLFLSTDSTTMNRSTAAPIFSTVAHGVLENSLIRSTDKENNQNDKTDKNGILCEMPPLGMPSVTAAESQKVFGSTTNEIVLPFSVVPWYREIDKKEWSVHCTVDVWLLSINSVTTVFAEVSECQHKLHVFICLPEILDIYKVDERNLKLYYTESGEPIYPESHIRAVSQKMALMTLPRNDQDEVYFQQTIQLPFKVSRDPVKIDGREGIQFKAFGTGGYIKQLVVELISAKSCYPKNTRFPTMVPVDFVSVAGHTCVPRVPRGGLVFSINPHTGVPQRQGPVLGIGNPPTQKLAPVQQVTTSTDRVVKSTTGRMSSGTSTTRLNHGYGTTGSTTGTSRLFDRVIPESRRDVPRVPRQATPLVVHQESTYDDDFFPTPPPVQVGPPLPPPPPVRTRSVKSVPIGRTVEYNQFKDTWSARTPYSTSTGPYVTPGSGLLKQDHRGTSIGNENGRRGTSQVPTVTQGTRSIQRTPSVQVEKVVPGVTGTRDSTNAQATMVVVVVEMAQVLSLHMIKIQLAQVVVTVYVVVI